MMRFPWPTRNRRNDELHEEIQAHLTLAEREEMESGCTKKEAQSAARREFGNVSIAEETTRDMWGTRWLTDFFQDFRYAVRTLRQRPGFAVVAIVTLALGIGANSAAFGLVDSAFLHALPFREPERLVHVWTTDASGELHTPSPTEYLALRKTSKSFQQVTGAGWMDFFYDDAQSSGQTLPGFLIASNWLPTLGVKPFLGRNFLDDEQISGRDAVVILSQACWRTRFHSDPHIVGKQINLNRRAVTIIGVLPQSLGSYFEGMDVFAPLVLDSYKENGNARSGIVRVQVVGRLRLGVTLDQARSETEVIAQQLREHRPIADRSGHLVVEDFEEMYRHPGPTRQNAQRGMWLTVCAAALVLLIACANVASLLLARSVKRHREIALRAALGCSRGRMIRQLLTESTMLFVCSGLLGLLILQWSRDIITSVASGLLPGIYVQVDARVCIVTLGVSFLTALFFGIIPALNAARASLNDTLKDAPPNAAGGSQSRRPRNLLVVLQIALGMVLLVGFGLLFHSLRNVESAHIGYDPRNVLTATLRLPPARYTDPSARARLIRDALDRARLLPAAESAGITGSLPMFGAESAQFKVEPPSAGTAPADAELFFVAVSPEYFAALKVPMLAGRPFDNADILTSKRVAIVNELFAKQYFPSSNPVGHQLALADSPASWIEIVGVVSDFSQRNPEEDRRPLAYFPISQTLPAQWSIAVRVHASADFASSSQRLTDWLREVDPQLFWQFGSMQQDIHDSESLALRRPIIALLASFGALALVLAIVGVFGVTSYSVSERTREIGIRVALGAVRAEIARLIFRETLTVTFTGLILGTFAAFAVTRFLPTGSIGWSGSGIFLYGVSRTDAFSYACAAVLLTSVTTAASCIPALRAMRVDPMVALRHE
ncbi:MAG TPA: ABC transporter permease [Candidatus Saccharimonadales bacterium]|nr:ABC transporter permease [Candidatus Saccharimonadales bacterium]